MISFDVEQPREWFGFAVAGNFAGHLDQAGEAGDFASVGGDDGKPRGIFPFYGPGLESFLGQFPLSSDSISLPTSVEPLNLQIEPEAAVVCRVVYAADGTVESLVPTAIGAFNDCSIRRPGVKKISEKKNWGANSKGLARALFPIANLRQDGPTESLRIASFLRRGPDVYQYGHDSAVTDYSSYGDELLDWIVERLANQAGAVDSPLESVGGLLHECGSPTTALIGIGATRYTSFGEANYLTVGDTSVVILYDGGLHTHDDIDIAVRERREQDLEAASVLSQVVQGS